METTTRYSVEQEADSSLQAVQSPHTGTQSTAQQFLKQVEAALQELAKETDEVRQSAIFQQYLDSMALFWQYSYRNQLLIHLQMPEATRVGGFRTWKGLGRNVKKGSKGIRILAPVLRKVSVHIKNDSGEEEESYEQQVAYFCPVVVFDIAQTEGKPLPEINLALEGNSLQAFHQSLIELCTMHKIKVDFKALGINGLYGYSMDGKVVISDKETINTQATTLIHEIAHELLHHNGTQQSKQQKEVQAEATTYVVSKHFGLPHTCTTYLALYNADYKVIMQNLEAVAEASCEIISFLEGAMPLNFSTK